MMNFEDMSAYGFTDRFIVLSRQYSDLALARITSQERGLYHVISQAGSRPAEISGRLRHQTVLPVDYPAVGDFVMVDSNDALGEASNETTKAVIYHVLPRKSVFTRRAAGKAAGEQVVAANIDKVFICMSLNSDFNLRRLERYVSIGWDSGAVPVVVLTKADLCFDIAQRLLAVEEAAPGIDIVITSASGSLCSDSAKDYGYSNLLTFIQPRETVAFMGSSGVGKSTLINCLLGKKQLDTNGLRNDDKGRHTTTRRELFLLPGGGMVIDTPGMRELGIWDSSHGIDKAFADIEGLISSCRFKDCSHNGEPGCAVDAALKAGILDKARWESYLKLNREAAYSDSKADYLAEKKKKFKEIARANRK